MIQMKKMPSGQENKENNKRVLKQLVSGQINKKKSKNKRVK